MRFLKTHLLAIIAVVLFVATSFGATLKRPLTVTTVGGQYMACWSGSAGVVTADNLVFMADTANSYGVDPAYFRMGVQESFMGLKRGFPGTTISNRLCASLKIAGDGDATSSLVYLQQAALKTSAHIKVQNGTPAVAVGAANYSQDTLTSVASDTLYFRKNLEYDPNRFWKVNVDPVSATDSIEVKEACFYTCRD